MQTNETVTMDGWSNRQLEDALIAAVQELDSKAQLPKPLENALHLFEDFKRQVFTQKRNGVVLNHEEYSAAQRMEIAARARLIEACVASPLFQ